MEEDDKEGRRGRRKLELLMDAFAAMVAVKRGELQARGEGGGE